MKALIAFGCVLLAVSIAQGQFIFLEQERSVSARAELSRTSQPPRHDDFHLLDEPTRAASSFEPFDETVTADVMRSSWLAHGTAWQQSTLIPTEISAAGGPRDVGSCCSGVNHSASARSAARIAFRLEMPVYLRVEAEILDTGDHRPLGTLYTSGDVYFSLTGPNLAIVHEPNTDASVGEPIPPVEPIFIDETRLVAPGEYELDIWASYSFRGDAYLADVYYDARLTATPISEPHSVGVALLCLWAFISARHYVFAHLGK